MVEIGIVIPYFQRREGLLARAVESVYRQVPGAYRLTLIIVDDESPVPAEEDLRRVQAVPSQPLELRVVRQVNGGVSSARNRALDELGSAADYVAFLDSDDHWLPHHIDSAVTALSCGHDFYFSDCRYEGQPASVMTGNAYVEAACHELLDEALGLYSYRGDFFDDLLRHHLVDTPTVVYRRDRFARLRFRRDLSVGEDLYFWLSIARAGGRAAFSRRAGCMVGRGINIYQGASWDGRRAVERGVEEIRCRRAILRDFALSTDQVARLTDSMSVSRDDMARGILHQLRRGRVFVAARMFLRACRDPVFAGFFPGAALRITLSKARSPRVPE